MFRRLSWGGVRGRGLSIKNDAVMSIIALSMATLVLILAYFLYERNAVKTFCDVQVDPAVTQTDQVVQRIEKVLGSDLVTKTPDPLNPEIDTAALRQTAASLDDQLHEDINGLSKARVAFANLPASPNPCQPCVDKTKAYMRTTDEYARDMDTTIHYLYNLVRIEATMNEAVRSVPVGGGSVSPAAMAQRDAILKAELAKIEKLTPPPMMEDFHRDTVTFLSDYITIAQQTTVAYTAGSDFSKLDELGREKETVLQSGRDKLTEDMLTFREFILGGQTKLLRKEKQSIRNHIDLLKRRYRF